jgi:phytoene dehydrogenase-like protein
MTRTIDVIVVGAGVAGLVAADVAARHGASVIVVDASLHGGRARSVEKDGFVLNLGGHALYEAGAFLRELRAAGIEPHGGAPEVSATHVLRAGERHPLPVSARALLSTRLLSTRGKASAAALFGRLAKVTAPELAGQSVDEWLSDRPADVAALAHTLIRLASYTHAPATFDAGAAVGQLQLGFRGVRYVDGGWQRLVDALRASVVARGGVVDDHGAVDAIGRDGSVYDVDASTGTIVARSVVVAAGGPAVAERLLGRAVPGVDRLGPVVEASCLDLGTVRPPEVPLLLGLEDPLYLSIHAPTAALAPNGTTLVSVMKYLPPGDAVTPSTELDLDLRRHAEAAGLMAQDVVLDRFLHHMTVHHGVPLALHRGLEGRPATDALATTQLDGVFLAGDWVGDEGMLADAAAASGAAAGLAAARHAALG